MFSNSKSASTNIRNNSEASPLGNASGTSNVTPEATSPPTVARLGSLWEVDLAAAGCQIHLPPHDLRTAGGSEEAKRNLSSYPQTENMQPLHHFKRATSVQCRGQM